ncbi:hydroxyacid dehydrogenase [Nioella sp. MMSF_3534]|uniref:hydroxyacid dehydrogenase n=1 Tax=Nioella sp. MMSF_3534 TaxID=3046720 RepID=UPI00273F745E|nr:hydroxyacid dehydrogenase [Nioella sp. MMSF_3534]
MPRLLVAGKLHPAGEARIAELRAEGVEVDYVEEISEASYLPHIATADALVLRTQPLTAETIVKAPNLKVVSRHGVGYDAVDLKALTARGIALTIVGDVNSTSVAEQAMMFLLAASKRVLRADRAVRDPAQWGWRNRLEQQEISGKTLLIVGYGRSGRKLAKMAAAFDMQVRAHDPYLERMGWPDGPVRPVALHEGLAWADCISVHIPKSDRPILGAAELQRCKPGVIIANTARGGVIDEAALADALTNGQVGGAGVDVFETEPPDAEMPLAGCDTALLTPHVAGLTAEASERMALASLENALGFLDGTIERSLIVNAEVIDV